MPDNRFMGAWIARNASKDLPRFANIRIEQKPISERVWSVFVGLCIIAGLYIPTAIAAAFFNYQ